MTIEFHHLIAWLIGDIFVSRMRIPGGAYFVLVVFFFKIFVYFFLNLFLFTDRSFVDHLFIYLFIKLFIYLFI